MTGTALRLCLAGGRLRLALLASCTAVVSALLLLVVTFARLPDSPREVLFNLVADPGVRPGTAFATGLLTLPPLLLMYQAVRLGSASRDRRLAALRLAGATSGEVRRLAAVEVALPASVGAVAGVGLYQVLRLIGGTAAHDLASGPGLALTRGTLRLVPTSVSPTMWDVAIVVLATTAVAAVVGARASRDVALTPWGVTRRQPARPPRPWSALLLVAAVVTVPVGLTVGSASVVAPLALVGLAVAGVMGLAPWAAYRIGRVAGTRAQSAALLLAGRRLMAAPRAAGRAAAAVGAIALVAGGGTALAGDLLAAGEDDSFYYLSLGLMAVALLVALAVTTGTLALHSVESLLEAKRSTASLIASGVSEHELESARRWEVGLVALPMATGGVALGSATLLAFGGSWIALLVALVGAVATLVLVWAAVVLAVRITRPWAVRAASAEHLRTA